jgi:hypothetical protein
VGLFARLQALLFGVLLLNVARETDSRMTRPSTIARTGRCEKCAAKHTHLLTLQAVDSEEAPNVAPFSCPACDHVGTLVCQAGHRIVTVQTRLYRDPLGR